MKDKFGIALGEASTWRSLVVLLTLAGVKLEPEQTEAIITAGVAIFGLIGVFFKRVPEPVK